MMMFSLVVMIGLEKCCITSACLHWLCHSGDLVFLDRIMPFSELWPFEKIWIQSCQQNISKTIEARALKLDE